MNDTRIATLRKEKNITQQELAEMLGVGRTTICGYEKGIIEPPASKLRQLSEYFNCSTDYLLGNSDVKNRIELTTKDKNDIGKEMQKLLEVMKLSQDDLTFHGSALDDATKQILIQSLQNTLTMGKTIAKQKFTPYKHRRE